MYKSCFRIADSVSFDLSCTFTMKYVAFLYCRTRGTCKKQRALMYCRRFYRVKALR